VQGFGARRPYVAIWIEDKDRYPVRTLAVLFDGNPMGFFAVLNDLHKGRDTGKAWGWMNDLSAVLMTLVSRPGCC
jgi:hypothetical protein